MRKLYINKGKVKIENIESLLKFLYPLYSGEGEMEEIKSYSDPECREIQDCSRNRSYGELWIIAKTELPNLTKKDFAKAIMKLVESKGSFHLMFCPNINKIVIYQGTWSYSRQRAFNNIVFDYSNNFVRGIATKHTKDGITLYNIMVKDLGISEYEYLTEMNSLINKYKEICDAQEEDYEIIGLDI